MTFPQDRGSDGTRLVGAAMHPRPYNNKMPIVYRDAIIARPPAAGGRRGGREPDPAGSSREGTSGPDSSAGAVTQTS